MINYRASSDEIRKAWWEYKKNYSGAAAPCVVSFIAGWNASRSLEKAEIKLSVALDNLSSVLENYENSK